MPTQPRRDPEGCSARRGAAVALAGCATSPARAARRWWWSAAASAARPRRSTSPVEQRQLDVTLVEPNPTFISCPMSNLVLGGSKMLADITVGYDELASARHQRRPRARGGDRCRARHACGSRAGMTCRTTGSSFRPASIHVRGCPGRRRRGAGTRAARLEAGAQTVVLRRQLEAMPDGGVTCCRFRRAVPLPARAVRARVPDRVVLEAREAAEQGADPRRERGRDVEEGVFSRPGTRITRPSSNTGRTRPSRRSTWTAAHSCRSRRASRATC